MVDQLPVDDELRRRARPDSRRVGIVPQARGDLPKAHIREKDLLL
jgi:hypothetical protein